MVCLVVYEALLRAARHKAAQEETMVTLAKDKHALDAKATALAEWKASRHRDSDHNRDRREWW